MSFIRGARVKQVVVSFGGAPLSSTGQVSATGVYTGMVSGDGVLLNPSSSLESQISGVQQAFIRQVVASNGGFIVYLSCLGGIGTANNVVFDVTRVPG